MLAVLPGVHDGARAAVLFDKNKPLHIFYKTHGAYAAKDASLTVADTRRGRLGMMFGQEGLIPEVARVQALMGCDILLWADDAPRAMSRQLQQTRSAENKIFTVRSAPLAAGESVLITSPEGIVMCAAQTGDEQAVGATLFTAMSRAKTVVPGTNIISGRHESAYGRIC
jgi:predicted amidohydrolase